MHHLRFRPERAPRQRLRGAPRYFRRVHRKAAAFTLDPGAGTWWDHWHYHADWPGWGNRGWRYRREHLRALARVFLTIADAAPRFTTPFQTWILLHEEDAGQDAVFLHTPNGNGTSFPLDLGDLARGPSSLTPLLQPLLPGLTLELAFGVHDDLDEHDRPIQARTTWIWAPGVGVPLLP